MCCTLLAQQRPRLGTEFDLYTVMTKLNFPYEVLYITAAALEHIEPMCSAATSGCIRLPLNWESLAKRPRG